MLEISFTFVGKPYFQENHDSFIITKQPRENSVSKENLVKKLCRLFFESFIQDILKTLWIFHEKISKKIHHVLHEFFFKQLQLQSKVIIHLEELLSTQLKCPRAKFLVIWLYLESHEISLCDLENYLHCELKMS